MHALLLNLLLPLGVEIVKQYIKSSSSKKDDLILSTVKDGCKYLAPKENNSIDVFASNIIQSQVMEEVK